MKIDENLNWHQQMNNMVIKWNRENALIHMIGSSANSRTLKSIYFAKFETHLKYANFVWT